MINKIKVIFTITLIFIVTSSTIIPNNKYKRFASGICTYFLFKWITNYRKCTVSYLECKIRGVKKEEGIIYQLLDPIINVNIYTNNIKIPIYLITIMILIINYYEYSR